MIGKILKYMRIQKKLSQNELAKLIKVERTTLSGYETERRDINFKLIETISEMCDYEIIFKNKITGEIINSKNISRKI